MNAQFSEIWRGVTVGEEADEGYTHQGGTVDHVSCCWLFRFQGVLHLLSAVGHADCVACNPVTIGLTRSWGLGKPGEDHVEDK